MRSSTRGSWLSSRGLSREVPFTRRFFLFFAFMLRKVNWIGNKAVLKDLGRLGILLFFFFPLPRLGLDWIEIPEFFFYFIFLIRMCIITIILLGIGFGSG